MITLYICGIYKDGTKTPRAEVYEGFYRKCRSFNIIAPKKGKIVSYELTGPIFANSVISTCEPPLKVKKGDNIVVNPIRITVDNSEKPTCLLRNLS